MLDSDSAVIDWYSATIDGADDGRVEGALSVSLGARLVRGKPRLGYGWCTHLQVGEGTVASVYGGSDRHGEVFVQASGDDCRRVVPVVRNMWLHRVSRADSALDFVADFEQVDAAAVAVAERLNVSHMLIQSSDGGATRYLGAPSAAVRVRVYRKTEQLRALHGAAAAGVPDGIVRCEVQVRPAKRAGKERLSTASPADMWGFSRWSSVVAKEVLGLDAERTVTHFRRPSDWERVSHYLAVQYGPAVRDRAADQGDAAVLAELAELFGLKV